MRKKDAMPRSVTPIPTVSPSADDPTELLVKRIGNWKILVAAVVALLSVGAGAYAVANSKADVIVVEQVRTGAAASLATATAGTSAQLGALAVQLQDQRERMAALEAHFSEMSKMTDRLFAQVVEIAKATGAKRVPADTSTTSPP